MKHIKAFFVKYYGKLKDLYEDQNLLEEKIFWGIVPLTTLVGLLSLVGTICENFGIATVICVFFCTFSPLTIALLCWRNGNQCRKYYVIFCLVMNCVMMPVTFLVKGGLYSGMPFYCFGFLIMCSFCSNAHDRHLTSSISFFLYVALFFAACFYPEIEMPIRDSFRKQDMILSFGAAAISLIIIISRAVSEYNKQRFRNVSMGMIDSLSTIIEFRSLETGDHVHKICELTRILLNCANEILPGVHYKREEVEVIAAAAMLHDIGKIAVSDNILLKKGKLTQEEYEVMKRHPLDGCKMIESMKNYQNHRYYRYCYEICRHHHEHYDGNGYPDRLKGDEIPLISQIVCLADVYEALTTKRVYKEAYSTEKACDIILKEEGHMFSPDMIRLFRAARPQMEALTEEMPAPAGNESCGE